MAGGNPLKIGYVWQYDSAKTPPSSATALHMNAVWEGFQRRGHQLRLVTIRNGQPHFSDDLETWHPIEAPAFKAGFPALVERVVRGVQSRLNLPYLRWFESYRFGQACAQALQGFDLIYERFWLMAYGSLLGARRISRQKGARVPVFYEINGDLVEEYAHLGIELSRPQWAVIHWITRQMFRRAGRAITVSNTLRERTLERWNLDPHQVTTVPNGADVEAFAEAQPDEDLNRAFGLNGKPVIMFVGSFKPWHGLDLLVDAFARLPARHHDAKLVFVGDGPVRAKLEAQAEALGLTQRIVFTGAIQHQDVPALLSAAQIAVLNPRFSPAALSQSPLKLFEYMASGKAIVAPATANIKDILADRENAWLVPPDNPEELAVALDRLLSDPELRRQLGATARQNALAEHSWNRTVRDLEHIFRAELAKDGRK